MKVYTVKLPGDRDEVVHATGPKDAARKTARRHQLPRGYKLRVAGAGIKARLYEVVRNGIVMVRGEVR